MTDLGLMPMPDLDETGMESSRDASREVGCASDSNPALQRVPLPMRSGVEVNSAGQRLKHLKTQKKRIISTLNSRVTSRSCAVAASTPGAELISGVLTEY